MCTQTENDDDDDDDDDTEDTFRGVKSKEMMKFGKPGTKDATVQWFKQTQSTKLKLPHGGFYEWFHGIITRRYPCYYWDICSLSDLGFYFSFQ